MTFDATGQDFTKSKSGCVTIFHWYAFLPIQQADKDTMRRNPIVKCCVEFENLKGPQIVLLSKLRDLMDEYSLQEELEAAAKRDGQVLPDDKQPKKFSEVNLAYDNPDALHKRKAETWRSAQERTYLEKGLPLTGGVTFTNTGSNISQDNVKKFVAQQLDEERERNNFRFKKIENDLSDLRGALDSHQSYFEQIIGLLQGKSTTASQGTPNSISNKLHDVFGGTSSAAERATPAPPYNEGHAKPVINQSIEYQCDDSDIMLTDFLNHHILAGQRRTFVSTAKPSEKLNLDETK
ncbi:hypothetical protein BDV12DRAFT_204894 [Aspergillus spectabilis]